MGFCHVSRLMSLVQEGRRRISGVISFCRPPSLLVHAFSTSTELQAKNACPLPNPPSSSLLSRSVRHFPSQVFHVHAHEAGLFVRRTVAKGAVAQSTALLLLGSLGRQAGATPLNVDQGRICGSDSQPGVSRAAVLASSRGVGFSRKAADDFSRPDINWEGRTRQRECTSPW